MKFFKQAADIRYAIAKLSKFGQISMQTIANLADIYIYIYIYHILYIFYIYYIYTYIYIKIHFVIYFTNIF